MPQPRISIQPVPLQAGQPLPVAELALDVHLGRGLGEREERGPEARPRSSGEKNRWAKWVSVALRSTNEMPSSTARPSICAKAGACDASKASLR